MQTSLLLNCADSADMCRHVQTCADNSTYISREQTVQLLNCADRTIYADMRRQQYLHVQRADSTITELCRQPYLCRHVQIVLFVQTCVDSSTYMSRKQTALLLNCADSTICADMCRQHYLCRHVQKAVLTYPESRQHYY